MPFICQNSNMNYAQYFLIVISLSIIFFPLFKTNQSFDKKILINYLLFCVGSLAFVFSESNIVLCIGLELMTISLVFLIPIASSIRVLVFNKFADGLLLIAVLFFSYESKTSLKMPFHDLLLYIPIVVGVIKTASFPFSSWALGTLRQTSPVNKLVSSGLVLNFGALLIIKYYPLLSKSKGHLYFLIVVGLITSLISFIKASKLKVESDKSLMLSLTQLGCVLVEIGLGHIELAIVHMFANTFYRLYKDRSYKEYIVVIKSEIKANTKDKMTLLVLKSCELVFALYVLLFTQLGISAIVLTLGFYLLVLSKKSNKFFNILLLISLTSFPLTPASVVHYSILESYINSGQLGSLIFYFILNTSLVVLLYKLIFERTNSSLES
ncbi:MAG: hypothetical protein ACI9QD_000225 [Thermoproteota archaeon]|jgi:hypothetical protein